MDKYTLEIEAKLDKATKGVEDLTGQITALKEAQQEQVEGLQNQIKNLEKQNSKTTKAVKGLAAGFKGVGLAMKSAGIGLFLALFNKLGEAMMRNQKVADTVEVVFTAIGMVFKEVSDRIFSVVQNVSEATGGFDALRKVLGGALSIAINLIVLNIQGMVLGVQKAQLAWEKSFLGGKDPEKIAKLQADIEATSDKISETTERIKTAGKEIGSNFVEAVTEVGTLATAVAEETADAIQNIDAKTIASNAKKVVDNKNNYALLEAQSQRLIEQYDLEAEQQRQIRDDVSLSVQERIDANNKLGEVLKEQSEAEKQAIADRMSALQEQINLEGESHELTAQMYQLQTEMLAIDAKVAGFKSEQLTNEVALKQELLDLDNSRAEATNEMAIAEANFFAEGEQSEIQRLEYKRQALEMEKQIELERLQMILANTNEGTQARVDAEMAIAKAKQDYGNQEIEMERAITDTKKALVQQGLDAVINAAGAESKVGKALFIAKQALALRELIMNAKNTLSKASMNAAEAGTDVAKGAAKAAGSAPFPANLIPIAGYAIQAIGIVSSIRSAMKTAQETASEAGGTGGSAPRISTPATSGGGATPPAFNIVGQGGSSQLAEAIGGQEKQPLKAYVVSQDVTTAQSLDRNIIETTSL
jgi:hypothetical protein